MYVVEYWAEGLIWKLYPNVKPNANKEIVKKQVAKYRKLGAGTLRIRKVA